MSSSVTQLYDMSDADAQELVVGLLQNRTGVSARPAASGPDQYVVVECSDPAHARSIFTLVTSVDPGATLLHATNGRAPGNGLPLELDVQ